MKKKEEPTKENADNKDENKNNNETLKENNNQIIQEQEVKKPPIDVVMKDYLEEVSKKTNDKYFIFCVQFILLFRECINDEKNKEQKKQEKENNDNISEKKVENPTDLCTFEYTTTDLPDYLPEKCNEFYSSFLEPNGFFCFYQESEKNEIIEILQHFCHWLFENKHTNLRLSLAQQ